MAFLGSGDQKAVLSLHVDTPDTVNNFGRVDAVFVMGEQEIDQHYQQQGSFTTLIPRIQLGDLNMTAVAYSIVMPVPTSIVHLFVDCLHPYLGLLRIRRLKTAVPAVATSLEVIEHWLKASCHKGMGEASVLAHQTCEALIFQEDDILVQ